MRKGAHQFRSLGEDRMAGKLVWTSCKDRRFHEMLRTEYRYHFCPDCGALLDSLADGETK